MDNWQTIHTLSAELGELLRQYNYTVTTAESCTGGGIAFAITEIAGSSHYFKQALVTYANEAKSQLLAVNKNIIVAHGAVSNPTVTAMAKGAQENAAANVAIATSGIAGPGGGSPDKPVGLVCFAIIINEQRPYVEQVVFKGDRHAIRQQAIAFALRKSIYLLKN